ncbi:DUF3592 domain-containing protein [Nocardioides sp.]|uniref:DUF3592 domain-containing protein n=1 Tax=Nocardioides sp. TaxID=35761 RepID=UPI002C8E92C5|nr:DUF3592 domain-containing protein [Nocardioides sp.]HXH77067.1 DUF3592 domain-containing protein [Nocardioides sp.]
MTAFLLIIFGLVLIAVAASQVRSMMRSSERQKTWFRTTAKVLRVHTESRRSGDDSLVTILVGTYEYYDRNEQVRTGSGDLGSQGVAVDGSSQVIDILVDPSDPTQSQILRPTSTGGLVGGVLVAVVCGALGLGLLMNGVFELGAGG